MDRDPKCPSRAPVAWLPVRAKAALACHPTLSPRPGRGRGRGWRCEAEGDQRAARSCREATPAAMLRPCCDCTLRGWSTIDLSEPPTSALAPTPTPTVASALTPP